jgi:hypothetical protein
MKAATQVKVSTMKKIAAFALSLVAAGAMARGPGDNTAWRGAPTCDYACLTKFVQDYMTAFVKHDAASLKQAKKVRFTENNVELPFGKEGMWATVTGISPTALIAADTLTGNAAWLGTAEENGKPVYFALRIGVRDGVLAEAESVVVRNTGLPLPFADVTKVVHAPEFNQILPEEQRRGRERLRAVADGYFNTVERNDGNIFTPFDLECGRLENGILTTAGNAAGTGGISAGCEAGLKSGAYYINKRIRERRYPVIDVERGVVVGTGFFDHANEFDRYKTAEGRMMNTALKWPNSISLIEAFKVRDSKILRIEAVFTYVPHMMHNPFYEHLPAGPPPAEDPATLKEKCDQACLLAVGDKFMTAFAAQKPEDIAWAKEVKFTENGVGLPVGESVWGSIRKKSDTALRVADPVAGTYAWYGLIYDHDAPAYAGVRLKMKGAKVAEAEVVVARERNPGPWGDPKKGFVLDARLDAVVPAGQRSKRADLIAVALGYAETMQRNDGTLKTKFDAACTRTENGVVVSKGEVGSIGLVKSPGKIAEGCEAQLKLGLYRPLDRLRGRRVLAVDEERGLVVMNCVADFGLAQRQYTLTNGQKVESDRYHAMSRELFEVYKIVGGRIQAVDAVSVDQPYGMPVYWSN